jgi:hypothetical protein
MGAEPRFCAALAAARARSPAAGRSINLRKHRLAGGEAAQGMAPGEPGKLVARAQVFPPRRGRVVIDRRLAAHLSTPARKARWRRRPWPAMSV